jgi:hypothetical protein
LAGALQDGTLVSLSPVAQRLPDDEKDVEGAHAHAEAAVRQADGMKKGHRSIMTAIGGAAIAYALVVRPRMLTWGATGEESDEALSGDELIPQADLRATRAITVYAAADHVWPWIAQLGQGRGGFYSYDFLENLIGCNIHSADQIVSDWQDIAAGDEIKLAPDVALLVASLEWGRSLVLRGGIPIRSTVPPYEFTWSFTLREGPNETTRLLVRERYAYTKPWAWLIVEPAEAISFLMSQKMLRGIRHRAERVATQR